MVTVTPPSVRGGFAESGANAVCVARFAPKIETMDPADTLCVKDAALTTIFGHFCLNCAVAHGTVHRQAIRSRHATGVPPPALLLFREVVAAQAANPDVAVAHAIVMFLQHERFLGIVWRVLRYLPVNHGADGFLVVVNHHAIEEHRFNRRFEEPLAFKPRRFEYDVVGLPLSRL